MKYVGRSARKSKANRVRTQHDVTEDLVVVHLNVADGDTQAENLLELELDRGADLGDLVREVLRVGDGRGELASCTRTSLVLHRSLAFLWCTYPWRDRGRADGESAL